MQARPAQAAQQAQEAPGTPAPPQAPVVFRVPPGGGEPSQVYEGFKHQRGELRDQLERLEDMRGELTRQLPALSDGPSKAGIEQRITAIDQRIADVEKQIAQADAAVAQAAAVPGAVIERPPHRDEGIPEEVFVISGMILVPCAFILTVAYARRLWRRGAAVVTSLPQEVYDRFTRVEQGIDAVAVEVERIGEGQRYLTRMYTERGLGAGAAQPIEAAMRERESEHRR